MLLKKVLKRIEEGCRGIQFTRGGGLGETLRNAYKSASSLVYYPVVRLSLRIQSEVLQSQYGIPRQQIFAYLANVKGITSAGSSLTRNAAMTLTLSNIGAMDGLYQYLRGKMGNQFDPKALALVGNELKVKVAPKVWEAIPSELLEPFSSVPKEFIKKSLTAYHRTVGEGITDPVDLMLRLIDDGVYSNIGVGDWVVPAKTGMYAYEILTGGLSSFVPIDRHHLRQFIALPDKKVLAKGLMEHLLSSKAFNTVFEETAESIKGELTKLLKGADEKTKALINRRLKQTTPDYVKERLAFRLADMIYSYANGLEMQRGVWAVAQYMMDKLVGIPSPLGEHYAKLWMAQRGFPMSTPSHIFEVSKIIDEIGEVGVELKDIKGNKYIVNKGEPSYERLKRFVKTLEKATKSEGTPDYNLLLLETDYKGLADISRELSAVKQGIIGRYAKP